MSATSTPENRNKTLDIEVPPGLKGVPVAQTELGDVRGSEGFFHYRQYDATQLAAKYSLEAIWYLLLNAELPSEEAEAAFTQEVAAARVAAGKQVEECLAGVEGGLASGEIEPLAALRAGIAAYAARLGTQSWLDIERPEFAEQAFAIAAAVPVFVAAIYRTTIDAPILEPNNSVGHAEDYLRMSLGEDVDSQAVQAIEKYLALTIDHGFNASTFTARVVTSTGADAGSALLAALGSLAGPLHGGAPSRALAMVDAIGAKENAESHISGLIERGERLMGFGHAVYTTADPRSVMLRDIAQQRGGELFELAHHVESVAERLLEQYKPGRGLRTNVEFYAALVMRGAGLPDALFTPTFSVSRAIGWTAQMLEQIDGNRIFRPAATYVGKPAPAPLPAP